MTSINFYHLLTTSFEQAFFLLASKMVDSGQRSLVLTETEEHAAWLDDLLWSFSPASFVPHGRESGSDRDALQPLLITTNNTSNANSAAMAMLLDGMQTPLMDSLQRVLVLFNGRDDNAVQTARAQWKEYKERGLELTYYKQNERGAWDKAA